VTLMVGGIDKQIYLPYQLAQGLGYYKKYGVNVVLSTEQSGGVGAEDAVASGQVNMAGAWYVHTIDFQQHGKEVIDVVQLSGAPGEREMCANGTTITSPAQWAGKSVGVTDLGSGTDDLTLYMAAKSGLSSKQFNRTGVGAGTTLVAALQHGTIVCGMTTQPTVTAIEQQHIGYSAIDLASTAGTQQWLGGTYPTASVLALSSWVNSNRDTVQKVVDALGFSLTHPLAMALLFQGGLLQLAKGLWPARRLLRGGEDLPIKATLAVAVIQAASQPQYAWPSPALGQSLRVFMLSFIFSGVRFHFGSMWAVLAGYAINAGMAMR